MIKTDLQKPPKTHIRTMKEYKYYFNYKDIKFILYTTI